MARWRSAPDGSICPGLIVRVSFSGLCRMAASLHFITSLPYTLFYFCLQCCCLFSLCGRCLCLMKSRLGGSSSNNHVNFFQWCLQIQIFVTHELTAKDFDDLCSR